MHGGGGGGNLALQGGELDNLETTLIVPYDNGTTSKIAFVKSKFVGQEIVEELFKEKNCPTQLHKAHFTECSDPFSCSLIFPLGLGPDGNTGKYRPHRKKKAIDEIPKDLNKQFVPSYFSILHPSIDKKLGENTITTINLENSSGQLGDNMDNLTQ